MKRGGWQRVCHSGLPRALLDVVEEPLNQVASAVEIGAEAADLA
jgi:hypothetical protein